ncbi:MAG: helix-turn-helix transcriptional regulator [Planctomycetota bacterium]
MAGKELIAASSRPLVLGILSRGDSYGYAILQEVKRLSGGRLEWTDGMLYPVLHRLERDGLISSRWGTAPDTGRRRKYYRLVRKGKKVLAEDRAAWLGVHETLTKLWGTGPCPA